jgi:hypothetical protein
METIESGKWLQTSYPWSAPQLVFSGIPPYCSLLQHIAEVCSEQKGKLFFYIFFMNDFFLILFQIFIIHLLKRLKRL